VDSKDVAPETVPDTVTRQFDARKYAKYVLLEGSPGEKRELLGAVKSKLVLKDKTIIKKDLDNIGDGDMI